MSWFEGRPSVGAIRCKEKSESMDSTSVDFFYALSKALNLTIHPNDLSEVWKVLVTVKFI